MERTEHNIEHDRFETMLKDFKHGNRIGTHAVWILQCLIPNVMMTTRSRHDVVIVASYTLQRVPVAYGRVQVMLCRMMLHDAEVVTYAFE